MTREEIIRMAREADREWDCDRDMVEWLEWFAALVEAKAAAAEREDIAKKWEHQHGFDKFGLAAAIRARGLTQASASPQTPGASPGAHGIYAPSELKENE